MCCAWSSGVSPGTAISRLAGTSRTEGSFRLPFANEGKLQMRSREAEGEALTHGGTLCSQVPKRLWEWALLSC